jgi:hypothetical protein
MKTTTTKYKGIEITNTPSEKYPNLVTLTKGVRKATSIIGKKFLTMEHATRYIDDFETAISYVKTELSLEKREAKVAQKELMKLNGVQLLKTVGQ